MTRLLALVGVLGISFSAIFVRLADVSPSAAAIYRTAYALPLLALGWLLVRERDLRPAHARWMAFLAGIFLAVDLALWHRAIAFIGAGLATVLANTQVAFVGLIAWALHKERPTNAAFLVVPLVFAGVALISGLGRPDAYGTDPMLGVLYGTLAGVAYSAFLLTFRASNRSLSPAVAPLLDATIGALVGSLALAPLDRNFDLAVGWSAQGWLLALALVSQFGGWLLITAALPRVPALDTSVLLLLQPMATVLWGLLIFRESLSIIQWTGVALVLGGVTILSARGTTRPPLNPV